MQRSWLQRHQHITCIHMPRPPYSAMFSGSPYCCYPCRTVEAMSIGWPCSTAPIPNFCCCSSGYCVGTSLSVNEYQTTMRKGIKKKTLREWEQREWVELNTELVHTIFRWWTISEDDRKTAQQMHNFMRRLLQIGWGRTTNFEATFEFSLLF